ncbi:MAG: hypothetical protein MZV64_52780 [Ignavibacteriales bacterium]|nr:hypothetical protein [Ignavibacteriales bacterium]
MPASTQISWLITAPPKSASGHVPRVPPSWAVPVASRGVSPPPGQAGHQKNGGR